MVPFQVDFSFSEGKGYSKHVVVFYVVSWKLVKLELKGTTLMGDFWSPMAR